MFPALPCWTPSPGSSACRNNRRSVAIFAKGKRRKNKKAKVNNGNTSDTATPQRITKETSHGVGGVRSYIKSVRKIEEEVKKANQTFKRTSYRKRKQTREEIELKRKKRNEIHVKQDPSIVIPNLHGTIQEEMPPVILVDGYNLLHKALEEENHRFLGHNIEVMRAILEEDLLEYSLYNSVKVAVAYDGLGYAGNDFSQVLGKKREVRGVDAFFCVECDGDTGILLEVDRLVDDGASQVLVISSDNQVRFGAFRPPRVFVKSSELFLDEMMECRVEASKCVNENNLMATLNGGLGSMLNEETVQKLGAIRRQLTPEEEEEVEVEEEQEQEEEEEEERMEEKEECKDLKEETVSEAKEEDISSDAPILSAVKKTPDGEVNAMTSQMDAATIERIKALRKRLKGRHG